MTNLNKVVYGIVVLVFVKVEKWVHTEATPTPTFFCVTNIYQWQTHLLKTFETHKQPPQNEDPGCKHDGIII